MAKFIDHVHELIDKFEAQINYNIAEYGDGFAPLPPHEENILMGIEMPNLRNLLTPDALAALEKDKEEKSEELMCSLNERQSQLYEDIEKTMRQVVKEVKKEASENASGESFHVFINDRLRKVETFKQKFFDALNPAQKQLQKDIAMLAAKKEAHEKEQRRAIYEASSDSEIWDKADNIERKTVSVECPAHINYGFAYPILLYALMACRTKEDVGFYMPFLHTDSQNYIHIKKGVEKGGNLADIDFTALRKHVDEMGEEMAAAPWKKVRTSRSVAYEYEAPRDKKFADMTERFIRIIQLLNDDYSDCIKIGRRVNGVIVDDSDIGKEAKNAPIVYRLTDKAVKDILVDGLGVRGIELPPERGRG